MDGHVSRQIVMRVELFATFRALERFPVFAPAGFLRFPAIAGRRFVGARRWLATRAHIAARRIRFVVAGWKVGEKLKTESWFAGNVSLLL